MVPTGSSLGLGDTIQDTGVLHGIDIERYTYCMVPTLLHVVDLILWSFACTVRTYFWLISSKQVWLDNMNYIKKQQEQAGAQTKQYHQSNQQ